MKNVLWSILLFVILARGVGKNSPIKGKKKSNSYKKYLIIILFFLSFICVYSIYDINKKSTPVAPFGSLNSVVRGGGADSYIDCKMSVNVKREHVWDCKAGILYAGDSEETQKYFEIQGNRRVDFIFYAMDSNIEIEKKDDERNWSIAQTFEGQGKFTPGFGEMVKEHTYKAVLVSVEDVKKCAGFVIYKNSSSGIPVPNNCFVDFVVKMPESSVGVGDNKLSFITPMVTTAGAQAKGQESSPGGDVEYILNEMGIISEKEKNLFFPVRGAFKEMKLTVSEVPAGWIPSNISPAPDEESDGFSYPEWTVSGDSKKVFQVASSGSLPPSVFSNLSLIISTIFGGIISAMIALAIDFIFKKNKF